MCSFSNFVKSLWNIIVNLDPITCSAATSTAAFMALSLLSHQISELQWSTLDNMWWVSSTRQREITEHEKQSRLTIILFMCENQSKQQRPLLHVNNKDVNIVIEVINTAFTSLLVGDWEKQTKTHSFALSLFRSTISTINKRNRLHCN